MSDVKKRGRKPNGGKIVQQPIDALSVEPVMPNIILHLKCTLNDLYTQPDVNLYESYQSTLQYETVVDASKGVVRQTEVVSTPEYELKTNASACFWCTCNYVGDTAYIPKCVVNDVHHVYGSFCSPECATAFLFNENVDSSIKFERYYLLNRVYGTPISSVMPAPAPFYTLNKFCGRLTIDEYRAQFKSDRSRKINVQMKRVATAFYNDGVDNTRAELVKSTRVMKKSGKKPNKSAILNDAFATPLHTLNANP
jgi:hypothetical protein